MFEPGDEGAFDDAKVLERMRAAIGLPDFNPNIYFISRWTLEGVLANKFHVGRVLLWATRLTVTRRPEGWG